MNRLGFTAALFAACSILPASANAVTIVSGSPVNVTVDGTDSVYQIFGHPGAADGPAATDAVLLSFAPATLNIFTFSASGAINCCSGAPNTSPDGAGGGSNIGGINGLSSISGNSQVPLAGVFTSETDPFGGAAPAALVYDANNPASLSPLLNQVFYIGDGLSGFNSAGSPLSFTAPTGATRLYLGIVDALSFGNISGWYGDNPGSFSVQASLTSRNVVTPGVPEPTTWAMMIGGFLLAGVAMRRRNIRVSFA